MKNAVAIICVCTSCSVIAIDAINAESDVMSYERCSS